MQEANGPGQKVWSELSRNRLLACLPAEVLHALAAEFDVEVLHPGRLLHRAAEPVIDAYFPLTCVITLSNVLSDGGSLQVTMVGCEGIVGVDAFLGGVPATSSVVLEGGVAVRIKAHQLAQAFHRSADVRRVLLAYTQRLLAQMAQTAVCVRHHSAEQQLCSLMLLALDRLHGANLVMTHGMLADLLGLRRETVTQAAHRLQAKGYVRYSRGHIRVLDRAGLERDACECYALLSRG